MYDFLTADLHEGHAKIATYCNRPEGWEELLISEWNRVVAPEHQVLLLGDFALFTDRKLPGVNWLNEEQGREILSRLHGHKTLLRGNHDQEDEQFYLNLGFEAVIDGFLIDREMAKIPLLFTHRAMEPNKARKLLFDDELSTRRYLNFHGHTHNSRDDPKWLDSRIHFNVGVDRSGYAPLNLPELLARLRLNR